MAAYNMLISDWCSDVCSSYLVRVNCQLMRRVRLDPGPYDLSDFPTGYGANDVRLNIVDDTGKAETLRFNMFFDQNQLAAGRSEFALYAGEVGRASCRERVCEYV